MISEMSKSYASLNKVGTLAGVTDDTIYGHQPSKVDPNEYSSMISKNSNFKSVYKVTSIK